jgi:hypothetical protein
MGTIGARTVVAVLTLIRAGVPEQRIALSAGRTRISPASRPARMGRSSTSRSFCAGRTATGWALVADKVSILWLCSLLAGCAVFPLSEADCRPASWQQRGYDDGYFGNLPQDLRLVQECQQRFGIQVAQDEYLAGWRAGYDEWDRLIGSFRKASR